MESAVTQVVTCKTLSGGRISHFNRPSFHFGKQVCHPTSTLSSSGGIRKRAAKEKKGAAVQQLVASPNPGVACIDSGIFRPYCTPQRSAISIPFGRFVLNPVGRSERIRPGLFLSALSHFYVLVSLHVQSGSRTPADVSDCGVLPEPCVEHDIRTTLYCQAHHVSVGSFIAFLGKLSVPSVV